MLVAVAVLSLLNGMVELQAGDRGTAIALLLICAATGVGFVVHQRRSTHPLMRLDLFEHRAFAMGGCVAFIYGMALFGSTYLVPVFMQIGAAPAAVAGRRRAAAGRPGARR